MRRYTDRFVVQEFVPGGEDRIYSFHAYVPRGSLPRVGYIGRKVRTYPSMGGESTLVTLVHNEEVMRAGWETVDRLGLTGIMKIDFKQHAETGRYYVLEVNLRCSLWTQLGARCGVNLVELAYRDLCGLSYEAVSEYRTDVCWLHVLRDVQTFFQEYRPKGHLSLGGWLRSYLGPKVYSTFAWDDPLPSILHLAAMVRSRSSRALEALRCRTTTAEPT
jgi:predicted ATP-grasp superfamily ATP-dependent carboligase